MPAQPQTATTISSRGVLEVAEHEGIVLGPYRDSTGVWTCGVGHTSGAGSPDPATMPREDTRGWGEERVEAELLKIVALFDLDLDRYEARVRKACKVPLTQHQFDALVSFDFNTGGIHRAALMQAINRGDMSGDGFMGWTRPREIIGRRKAEQALFRTGNYDANGDAISLWDVTASGSLRHRGAISGARLAALMARAGAKHEPATPSPIPGAKPLVTPTTPPGGLIAIILAGVAALAFILGKVL